MQDFYTKTFVRKLTVVNQIMSRSNEWIAIILTIRYWFAVRLTAVSFGRIISSQSLRETSSTGDENAVKRRCAKHSLLGQQTDRQKDRQADRDTHSHTDKQTDKQPSFILAL